MITEDNPKYQALLDENRKLKDIIEKKTGQAFSTNKQKSILEPGIPHRDILDTFPFIFCEFNQWFRLSYINKSGTAISGYSLPADRNLRLHQIMDDAESILREYQKKGTLYSRIEEYKLLAKDGSNFYLTGVFFPIIGDGHFMGLRCIGFDETKNILIREELRKSEEKYRSLTNRLPVGVYRTTRSGAFLFANKAFADILGYDNMDELLSKSVQDLYESNEDRESELSCIKQGEQFMKAEIRLKRKDGSIMTARDTYRAYYGDNGETLYFDGIIEDITETKLLEARLKQAEKLQAIGTLAGGIAHDFNNLLMGMHIYSELALKEAGDNLSLKKNIEKIISAQIRAKQLIQQILTFSNHPDAPSDKINILSSLVEVIDLMRNTFPSGIELESNLVESGWVEMNVIHLHQLMMNLITNAIHAMEGHGKLYIALEPADSIPKQYSQQVQVKHTKYARLIIADTGCGMDKKTMERIFDPFFTTKKIGMGTGLGLSIVHGIVARYDGEIFVESKVGEGTTFYIYLPEAV